MSATKTVTLWCDAPGCIEWTVGTGTDHRVPDCRRAARDEGWVYRSGKDYCPAHPPTNQGGTP